MNRNRTINLSSAADFETLGQKMIESQFGIGEKLTTLELQNKDLVRLLTPRTNIYDVAQISASTPWNVVYQRRYLYVLRATALQISLDVFGQVSLPAGQWTLLLLQQGTKITAPGQANLTPIQILHTDELLPDLSDEVASAGSITYTTQLTQTNNGADTPLPFAFQVNHFLIQNPQASVMYVDLDTVASTSSLQIAAGGSWRDDIQVSTIHVFTASAGTLPIVRGWL